MATLVNGPSATRVISPGASITDRTMKCAASIGSACVVGRRQEHVALAVGAVDECHRAAVRHCQRAIDTLGDRNIGAVGDLQQLERVGGAHRGVGVAEHRCDSDDVEFRRGERVEDGHGVVDARVRVDQDLSCPQRS